MQFTGAALMNIRWREGTIVYRVRGKRKYVLAMILAFASVALWADADRPYAPSRDYDLRHSKIELRFDLEKRKVIGSVTHWLVALNEGTTSLSFDSVGLTIHSVSVNSRAAEFVTTLNKLVVKLPSAARAGEKIDVEIRYEGKPRSGLYFMLQDRDYPKWPKQIWTQGEPEDTRYYLPIYDYPNDRLTTEMVVTVPAEWITISNGRLVSVTKGEDGLRTWRWSEAVPSSTYLITLVAGEFDGVTYP